MKKLILIPLALLVFSLVSYAEDKESQSPLPSQDEMKSALATVKDVFKEEYKNLKTLDDRKTLVKKLLEQAHDSANTPAMAYALVSEAARLAAETGDVQAVADASLLLSEKFQGENVFPERYRMLKAAESAKTKLAPEALALLAEEYLRFADETIAGEDFNDAVLLAADAGSIGTKIKNKDLAARAADKKKEASDAMAALKAVAASLEKLKANPDDPDANFAVGKYNCFIKGDWELGLQMLAKCSNPDCKTAAELDLAGKDTASILKAADKWWDLAESVKDKAMKSGMKARAAQQYSKILPELGGMDKVRVEKRVNATETTGVKPVSGGEYLVVDLNSGKLTYLASAPSDTHSNDVYKADKLVMRRVQTGSFKMGDSGNQRKVTLTKDFHIGIFEVTQGQWEKVMKTTPSNFKDAGKDAPVERVSWEDCQAFINELNGKKSTPQEFRLPTEAEWEYACRGGKQSKNFEYSGSGNLDEVAWLKDNSGGKTHPVGKKKSNELGLYDMSGNVWEWCNDWFGDYPKEVEKDPQGAKSGSNRVVRGGSWRADVGYCRCARRECHTPLDRYDDLGFRLCLGAPLAPPAAK